MLNLSVSAQGKTFRDLEYALEEVLPKIRKEYLSGMDSNDDGGYFFDVTGEEAQNEEEK